MEESTDWLTSAQVAEELGCTRANVSRLVQGGKLRAERHGVSPTSPYRIHRDWLAEYAPPRTPDMLTVVEAAAAIGGGVDAIWKALGEGRIRGERVGSRRLIRREELDRYQQDREVRYSRASERLTDRARCEEQALHEAGFLTVAEAAARLGLTRAAVQYRINAGQLRSERRGWRYAIRPEWIDEHHAKRPRLQPTTRRTK